MVACHVEEDTAACDTVGHLVDAVGCRAAAGHRLQPVPVVHLTPIEDVRQGVPLSTALQWHRYRVIAVTKNVEVVLGTEGDISAVLEHGVDRIRPAAEPAGCGPSPLNGSAQDTTVPVLTSAAASAIAAGVMKFSVPRSSSSPHLPQLRYLRQSSSTSFTASPPRSAVEV